MTPLSADLVDFENADSFGGDDAVATNSYFADYGLSVTALAGADGSSAEQAALSFEAVGRDGTDGFWTDWLRRDEALSGSLGNYFLKAGTGDLSYGDAEFFQMSIDYDEATTAASGEIWDIDGPEQYQVTAYDSAGNAVASLESPTGGLNAEPWTWSVEVGGGVKISNVEITATGNSTLRGFAFDNFDSTQANINATSHNAPIPAAFPIGCVGLAMYFARTRRLRTVGSRCRRYSGR